MKSEGYILRVHTYLGINELGPKDVRYVKNDFVFGIFDSRGSYVAVYPTDFLPFSWYYEVRTGVGKRLEIYTVRSAFMSYTCDR